MDQKASLTCRSPSRFTTPMVSALLLMMPTALTVGCAGTYRTLPSETTVPELVALARAAAKWPERTTRVAVARTGGRAVHVAVHETTSPSEPRERVVVLIHGAISDSRMWRYLRGSLAADFDLMAVDLVGCGHSDRPTPGDRGPNGYAPDTLARDVFTAVRQRLGARQAARNGGPSPRLTLVGHSLGGTVILRMLSDGRLREDFADVLALVDGTVLFSPADVAVDPNQPTLRAVATVTDLEVAVARVTGILPERVAAGIRDGVTDPRLGVREEANRQIEILADGPRRHAAAAMLKQASPLRGWRRDRPDWERVEALVAGYARVDVPCLIIWGGRDELLPLSMGYKLAEEIPGARLCIIAKGMHCLPTERPLECSRILRDFIGGGRAVGPAKVARVDLDEVPAEHPNVAPRHGSTRR